MDKSDLDSSLYTNTDSNPDSRSSEDHDNVWNLATTDPGNDADFTFDFDFGEGHNYDWTASVFQDEIISTKDPILPAQETSADVLSAPQQGRVEDVSNDLPGQSGHTQVRCEKPTDWSVTEASDPMLATFGSTLPRAETMTGQGMPRGLYTAPYAGDQWQQNRGPQLQGTTPGAAGPNTMNWPYGMGQGYATGPTSQLTANGQATYLAPAGASSTPVGANAMPFPAQQQMMYQFCSIAPPSSHDFTFGYTAAAPYPSLQNLAPSTQQLTTTHCAAMPAQRYNTSMSISCTSVRTSAPIKGAPVPIPPCPRRQPEKPEKKRRGVVKRKAKTEDQVILSKRSQKMLEQAVEADAAVVEPERVFPPPT